MEITCSRCRRPYTQPVRVSGLLDGLLSVFYSYPFRCQVCRHRFHIMQWGVRYDQPTLDRREYRRRPVRIPVTLHSEHGDLIGTGIVTDLSMGGCSIATEAHLPVGSLLQLRIDAVDQQPSIIVETAIVRSVRVSKCRGTGIGVEFLRFGSDENRLSDYILTLWMEGTIVARKGRLEEPVGAR